MAELNDVWAKVVDQAAAGTRPNAMLYALVPDIGGRSRIGTTGAHAPQAALEQHYKPCQVEGPVSRNEQVSGEMGYVTLRLFTEWLSDYQC